MGQLIPTFELILNNSGTVGFKTWVNLGLIPNDQSIWFGFGTFIAQDKTMTFELRTNLAGQSAGTTGATKLHDFTSATDGQGSDRDFYHDGNTIMMSATSTGIEHTWLRVQSKSSNVGTFIYILYYTLY